MFLGFDQRIEYKEKFFLRAVLSVEELDIVEQQDIERAVVALEGVEGFGLVGAHDVGVVILRVNVADDPLGVLLQNMVTDGVDEVGLAESGTAIDEHRVIGTATRVGRHLQRCGTCQIVGFADNEVVEGKAGNKARFLVGGNRVRGFGRRTCRRGRAYRRPSGSVGLSGCFLAGCSRFFLAVSDHERNVDRDGKVGAAEFLDTPEVTFLHPFQDESVGSQQAQPLVRALLTLQPKRPDPGIELLGRKFLFELTQARIPEAAHYLLRTCIHANQNRKKTGIVKAPSIIRRTRYVSKQRLKKNPEPLRKTCFGR